VDAPIDFRVLAGDLLGLSRHVERAEGVAARRYALSLLETALAWADPGTVDPGMRARASSLGVADAAVAATHRTPPLHAVRIPLVDAGSGRGLVRTFFASFDAAPPNADASTEHALSDAFEAARSRAGDPRVRAIRFVAAQPRALDRIRIEGESIGAGAFVSASALLGGLRARPSVAVTGALRGDRIVAVSQLDAKIVAAQAAGLQRIVVPGAGRSSRRGRLEIVPVATLDALLAATLEPDPEARNVAALVAEARRLVGSGWRGFRWPEARELLERAIVTLPDGELDTRVDLLAHLGAAERHAGSLARSESLLRFACAVADSAEGRQAVPDELRSRALLQSAMTALRLAELRRARREARRAMQAAVRSRSRRAQIKALGVIGLVEEARGAIDDAVAALEQALALGARQTPGDLARSRSYLAAVLAAGGHLRRARTEYRTALEETLQRGSRSEEAWVRTAFGRGLVAAGRHREAREVLDVPVIVDAIARDPLPGLSARCFLGAALASEGRGAERERGLALLDGALDAHGPDLEPTLARLAALCLLHAALLRDDALPTATTLAALARFGEGRLGREAARLRHVHSAALRPALARFVAQAQRVAW
jgi:tetratricopeptide (TPR) repeat protein